MLQLRLILEKTKRLLQPALKANWLRRLVLDRSVREAFFVFAITRTLIFVIFVFVGHMTVTTTENVPTNVRDSSVSFANAPVARRLRETMWRADIAHYLVLAREGYEHAPFNIENSRSRAYAFFPLHPFLLWLISKVTSDVMLAGAALCNLFFFISLILLHKLTLQFGYDESTANRAIFYLATYPVSYFFSVPLTESLFLLLTLGSFYAASRGRWWFAGSIGALASATRVNGILLLPALLVLYWQRRKTSPGRNLPGLLLIPVGLLAYMLYSWVMTGDALAFKHAHEAWGRHAGFFLTPLIKYLMSPSTVMEPWAFHLLNFAAAMLAFVCVYLLARRREWALSLYTLTSILLPLSSGVLTSLDRLVAVFFPIYIALAVAGRSRRIDQTIRVIFISIFSLMTALFAANYTIAVL